MTAAEITYRLWLRPGRERSVAHRHPWVYSGAVERIEIRAGGAREALGEIVDARGELLATATVNPEAPLVARILKFGPGAIDAAHFAAAFARAAELRRAVVPPRTNAYRLVNAEGDGLPGLIVDRYGDFLVVQCLTLGMSYLEPLWLPALVAVASPRGVIERSERATRDPDLARVDGVRQGEAAPARLEVEECGHRFLVDLAGGQKTGFYLDQRENRQRIGALSAGRRVLNAFAYTGAFGVYAGAGGAREVVQVETSEAALDLARENWALNDLSPERMRAVREPAQRFLRRATEPYDLIVLDPPPFARERRSVPRAARAYKDLNLWALQRLVPGGYLATFSCSQAVTPDLFQKIVFGAALDARVRLQWIARLGAAPDHPVHLDHPEGEYLKGLWLRSVE
jgi:23S rRNA (cytosine1962-C5)-methyltransferase